MSETRDLATVVAEYGLSATKAKVIVDGFKDVFEAADRWEKAARDIVVADETQTHIMAAARSLRLEIKTRRVAVERAHKEQKADILIEGRALDGIKNVLLGVMVPLEKYLGEQENFAKIREEAREIERREKAERLLAEQEERKAAEEALAHAKRQKAMEEENARLKVEAEKREKANARERAKVAREWAAERAEAGIRLEVENIKRAAERAEADWEREKEQKAHDEAMAVERAERQAADRKASLARQRENAKREREREAETKKRAEEQAAYEKELAEVQVETARLAAMVKCPECGHTFDGREHPGE